MSLLVVKRSFVVGTKMYRKGTVVDSTDPNIEGRESLFGEIQSAEAEAQAKRERQAGGQDAFSRAKAAIARERQEAPVEVATAAPGEKRAAPPGKPKATKPKATKKPKAEANACPDCEFVGKTALGLESHRRAKH